jgi:hypothetical protein
LGNVSFTVGLPRSGKSVFSKNTWQFEAGYEGAGRVVLSGDDFRYAVYNQRFSVIGEELVRASVITSARALCKNYDILIDETNTSKTSILQILSIDHNAHCYFITTKKDICIDRACKDGFYDLIPSIERMAKNLEENLDFIYSLPNLTIVE